MTDTLVEIIRARRLRALSHIKAAPRRTRPSRVPLFKREAMTGQVGTKQAA
ncbi:hypothetical protein [Tropicibacter sp. S64]|uniref:hypothetical protein n=1 Tax=Tropicibacter sp. S64 TaxID=3415122 RepID=UPI003C7EABD7